jgi:hypothetical protein
MQKTEARTAVEDFPPPVTVKFGKAAQPQASKAGTQLPPPPGLIEVSADVDFQDPSALQGKFSLPAGEEMALGTQIAEGQGRIKGDVTVDLIHCCIERDRNTTAYWFTDWHSQYGSYYRIPPGGTYTSIKPGIMFLLGSTHLELLGVRPGDSTWRIQKAGEMAEDKTFSNNEDITIGKMPDYKIICLDDQYLSGQHAVIKYNRVTQTYTLHDGIPGIKKASTNGTWLKMGPQSLLVQPGTEFKIGEITYLLLQ